MSSPTTQPQLSSHNPFRTPLQTPNPTGASANSSVPSFRTALPFSNALLTPTPTGIPAESNAPSYETVSQQNADSDDEDAPEALPDLTPRMPSRDPPNQYLASLPPAARNNTGSSPSASPSSAPPALPPRRTPSATRLPSSSPPPIHLLPDLPPDDIHESAPPAYSITPDIGGGETIVEQGPRRPFQRAPEPILQLPPPSPHPPLGSPGPFRERPLSQISDYGSPPPPAFPLQQQSLYAPPPGPPPGTSGQQQPRYAPPPGAPPSRPRAASTSRGAGSTAPPASDGYPTTTPTPGHPLLRNGRTLVYPESYVCPKCNNTGYKNNDPSHPCRKCWDRFGKLFSSILASSPWGDRGAAGSSQSQHGRTFQRPLPSFKPPQARTVAAPPRQPPQPGGFAPPPQRTGPPVQSYGVAPPPVLPYGVAPPPGAAVVMPGDTRLGGRRCWRCGGRGTTPFLIFDELPCDTCGGVGRLFD